MSGATGDFAAGGVTPPPRGKNSGHLNRHPARDLALPRGHCGKGVAGRSKLGGNSELVFWAHVGVGVVRPLIGKRRAQKKREGGGAKEEGRVKERQSKSNS